VGQTAIYQYDAVGNLLGIVRQPASTVSILNFTPKSGPVGTTVTLVGTGYSATASQNTVKFNGTTATVTSATTTQLVVTVPTGATTGPINVTTPGGSTNSSTPFTVTASGAGVPTITSFTPMVGTVGTVVTINGMNFDPVPEFDRIQFAGFQSFASAATPTTLTTSVPAGQASGRISVTTQGGTGISTADFFVPPPSYTAADVSFTGRLQFGQSQITPITGGGKIALLIFDGTAGQKVSVKLANSTFPYCNCFSTRLGIRTPTGSELAGVNVSNGGDGFLDTVTLPITGTYTVLLDASGTLTGQATLTLYSVADVTTAITPNGPAVPINLATPGQNALLPFSGTAGQKVSVKLTSSSFPNCNCATNRFAILKPDGTELIGANVSNFYDGFLDAVTLPSTGTYTVSVNPYWFWTGQATINLYTFTDVTTAITPNGPAVVPNLATPGQNALLPFSGTAGQKVSAKLTNSTFPNCNCVSNRFAILKPDGTELVGANVSNFFDGFLDAVTLPTTGTYTVSINPGWFWTGQATINLYSFVDVTTAITPSGPPVPINLASPGQNALLPFSGTAGQKVSARLTNSTFPNCNCTTLRFAILKPDGTELVGANVSNNFESFLDTVTLPTTGTYTVSVNPGWFWTGQATITLYNVVTVTGSLTINGSALPVSLPTPGQTANLTFSGTANQQVTVRITGNTISSVTVRLLRPDTTVLTSATSSAASFNLTQQTLPTTGTYTVQVDPPGTNTGALTVNVTSP
jgi:hypothetical protein